MRNTTKIKWLVFFLMLLCTPFFNHAQNDEKVTLEAQLEEDILNLIEEGDIPGLSLIIIKEGKQTIKNYGYANVEEKIPVSEHTRFELASCSKAFTALAFQRFIEDYKVNLDTSVSVYLPWFEVYFEEKRQDITLRQLLHHTSGIPQRTIAEIPEGNTHNALENTVKRIVGIDLSNPPGNEFEYATINYDILALIIEKVSKKPFENYINDVIFKKLNLDHTSIGVSRNSKELSKGYKISFYEARPYEAPIYRGNNAAGYVISNAVDMAKWLKFQIGITPSPLYTLAQKTQRRDATVAPQGNSSYAMGWQVSLSGNGEIYHSGLNPNFTSYVTLKPKKGIAVAVLANSNSNYTNIIGDRVMNTISGNLEKKEYDPGDGNDAAFSLISIILSIYVLLALLHFGVVIYQVIKGDRRYKKLSLKGVGNLLKSLLFVGVLLLGIGMLPKAMAGFTWDATIVWAPLSFIVMVIAIVAATAISYLSYSLSFLFPGNSSFKQKLPKIILVSIFSGISNMAVVLLITSSFNSDIELKYLSFYYFLTLMLYITGRKYVQITLIHFTRDLIYEKRIKLIEQIFSTSYQKFEKIDKGRVYSTLNDDVGMVGNSVNMIVSFVTSLITVGGAFIYLASIEFWATVMIFTTIVAVSALYFAISNKAEVYFEEARDTQNTFMRLLNGLIDGFKEISLQYKKKLEYKGDIASVTNVFKNKTATAHIKFINAYLVGESTFILLLGMIAFGIPEMFPEIQLHTIMGFVVILLYLNGPLNTIFTSMPTIMQVKIAWNRIQSFIDEIPANLDLGIRPDVIDKNLVYKLTANDITYKYENENGKESFSIGPVNLEINRGEILFIIGGNGSGKTTLAKLLTGLYQSNSGKIAINDKEVTPSQLSEYFSVVFSPCHLFHKLYNLDLDDHAEKVEKYLKLLGLFDKVEIKDNAFNTLNLSAGQRKRLALLQCYLEDSPIYLFDEWAADQDPEYRRFFYRELLPDMKRKGKIIIAITHDDHYFDVADKIIKMDVGRVDLVSNDYKVDHLLTLSKV
ncbi:cyclic peptide export ABC transporter [Aquimarina sp. 2304DJ70-9]|uniref:cyclic peptide export ABC transporter n=1 Tax=Aquimarina penaris TaxID=3231044 RepID=UPI003462591D